MHAKKISETTWMLRLIKGEEILQQVETFCLDHDIRLGYFTGLGAMEEFEIGIFLHDEKRCISETYQGNSEIIALHGNITTMDGRLYLHSHLGAGLADLSMVGGRMNKAIVNPTCELILHSYEGTMDRFLDEDTGLNLLKYAEE